MSRRELTALVAGSRLAIWAVAVGAFLLLRDQANGDPYGLGETGDAIGAGVWRKDALFYGAIAEDGYGEGAPIQFFPLYPLLVRAVGWVVPSTAVAGALVSLAALVAALVLLERLTTLELGPEAGRRAVYLLALFPTAVFLTAVYTESLFLALTIGAFYAARKDRWVVAGLLGALAAATRNTGIVLVIPLALLYLHQRRALRADALWIALVPLGLVAFSLYSWAELDDPLAWVTSHERFDRSLNLPLSGAVLGAWEAIEGLYHAVAGGGDEPRVDYLTHVAVFGFLVFTVIGTVGALRRLPAAYGVYAGLGAMPPLTAIVVEHPLSAFARYIIVLFPLHMWLAAWADTPRRFHAALAISAAGCVVITSMFALGRFS